MNNKPSFWSFAKVNFSSYNFSNTGHPLIYKNKTTGEMYTEKNDLKNRLRTEIPYALFPFIMFLLYKIAPQWRIWNYSAAIVIGAIFLYVFYSVFLRYLFANFVKINTTDEAKETGYKKIELLMFIIPSLLLYFVYSHIFDTLFLSQY